MGLFGTSNFSVTVDSLGRLYYREANRRYLFPFFLRDGEVVLVPEPSRRWVHFFFGWYADWRRGLSAKEASRIVPRLREHLREQTKKPVEVFDRGEPGENSFQFYPELFEDRGHAMEILEEVDVVPFSDYGSVDLLQKEYGLEVCGIHKEESVETVRRVLTGGFPHWHFGRICFKDYGREPGWKVSVHMFRRDCREGRGWMVD